MTKQQTVIKPDTDTKSLLIEQFELGKKLNAELLNKIKAYAVETDSLYESFVQELTFAECIKILEEIKQKIFNAENREATRLTATASDLNKSGIEEIIKNVNMQIKHHYEIEAIFKSYTNHHKAM